MGFEFTVRSFAKLMRDVSLGKRPINDLPPSYRSNMQPLPPILYHVTTSLTSVQRMGLLTTFELCKIHGRSKYCTGLGQMEPFPSVSFTDSFEMAKHILDTMLFARRVYRNEIPLEKLIFDATKGIGAKKPWLRLMSYYGTFRFNKRSLHFLQLNYKRDMSKRYEFLNEWLRWRERAGGPVDPFIIGLRPQYWAERPESEFAILVCKSKPHTFGNKALALGEWYTYTGKAVKIIGVVQ